MKLSNRFIAVIVVTLLALVIVGRATWSFAQGGNSSLIHGCIMPGAGQLRVVDPDEDCHPNETAVDLVTATGDGKVGIGTADPKEALDVVGNISASGTIASGNSIVIDGYNDVIVATSGTIDFDNENLVTTGNVDAGSLAIKSNVVVNSDGQWAGDPTGLQGPAGSQGPPGPQGPQGEQGPPGTLGALRLYKKYEEGSIEAGMIGMVTVTCEAGDLATGGGYTRGFDVIVGHSQPWDPYPPPETTPTGWAIIAWNQNPYERKPIVWVVCADLTP